MSRRKRFLDEWAKRGKSPSSLPEKLAEEKVKAITTIQALVVSGYAGVDGKGMIVDRREHPDAIPIQANRLLGVPEPKEACDDKNQKG